MYKASLLVLKMLDMNKSADEVWKKMCLDVGTNIWNMLRKKELLGLYLCIQHALFLMKDQVCVNCMDNHLQLFFIRLHLKIDRGKSPQLKNGC